ncbi:MAG: HD domain-containing protein [bacterium]
MQVHAMLARAGIRSWLSKTSALDRYFRMPGPGWTFLDVEGSLVDIARVFDSIEYPGLEGLDALVRDENDGPVCIRCLDSAPQALDEEIGAFTLRYDLDRGTYVDPADMYRSIRKRISAIPPVASSREELRGSPEFIMDTAVLVGRYGFTVDRIESLKLDPDAPNLAAMDQRILLSLILTGDRPEEGLAFLRQCGFIDRYWPLLTPMDDTDHSKEFHPEGNVWEHTIETLRYRKTNDIVVTLALLLHDCGKPYAAAEGSHRFKNHADIGAEYARRFLRAIGFDGPTVEDVTWLIRYHMIPGALESLPRYRTRDIMRSKRFPQLLELYRCDLSSTFRGPDGYYRACRVYRSFLKHDSNPFRDSEGKKVLHMFVE